MKDPINVHYKSNKGEWPTAEEFQNVADAMNSFGAKDDQEAARFAEILKKPESRFRHWLRKIVCRWNKLRDRL